MPIAPVQLLEAPAASSVDAEEVARFSGQAGRWWDTDGPFAALHAMNPVRMRYIKTQMQILRPDLMQQTPGGFARFEATTRMLDVGCGGGLLCESLARLGAQVTGIDASRENIDAASAHARQSRLSIDYKPLPAEALAQTGAQYDVVLALEMLEHVASVESVLDALLALTRPGGLLILSTLNRTATAYALAIVGAEYVARMVPRGTHDWKKFIRPSALARQLRQRGAQVQDMAGLVYHPLRRSWTLEPHKLDVNYILTAVK